MNQPTTFKSGYASIIGRPNVGKSTLLNQLVAQKVAATSNRPQTTRNKITGVVHLSGAQIILVDTPGIHETKRTLNEMMVQASLSTYGDVDLILVLIDAVEGFLPEDEFVLKSMENTSTPKILVINKIDLIEKPKLLTLFAKANEKSVFKEIIPVSALKDDGIELLNHIKSKNKDIPVIIISGHANIEMAVKSLKSGAFEFIQKPFDKERLLNFVNRAVENYNLKNENKNLSNKLFHSFEIILMDSFGKHTFTGIPSSKFSISS